MLFPNFEYLMAFQHKMEEILLSEVKTKAELVDIQLEKSAKELLVRMRRNLDRLQLGMFVGNRLYDM